jgi:hypothetical protein
MTFLETDFSFQKGKFNQENFTMLDVEIHIKGHIAPHWSDWFEGLTITQTDDETILTGEVDDQSALFGLLARVRDLGLSLVSVESVESVDGSQ